MLKNKYISIISIVLLFLACVFVFIFASSPESLNIEEQENIPEYVEKVFNDDIVHTIDIQISEENWSDLLENAIQEEYYLCDIVLDGETFSNVAIRAKGNTSLSQVASSESDRYSFKIKFNEYEDKTCYGLDKLSLNNLMADATYMKDYFVYDMMRFVDADAPYSSFMNVTVNGEPWGLYLGIECIDESFLIRNYGNDYGELYKPDSMEMGEGKGSQIPDRENMNGDRRPIPMEGQQPMNMENQQPPMNNRDIGISQNEKNRGGFEGGNAGLGGRGPGGMSGSGSDLVYTDDEFDSYSTVFDGAKTNVTDSDKIRLVNSLKVLASGENLETVIDIENTLKYWVVHNFVLNGDSYTGNMLHNYYLYEKDGIMTMLPWDYNLAFGGFSMGGGRSDRMNLETQDEELSENIKDMKNISGGNATSVVNSLIDNPLSSATEDERPFWGKLIQNAEYKELYHKYFYEFINDYFVSGYFEEKIDKVYNLLLPFVKEDVTAFYSEEEFIKGVETLKEFCLLRSESVEKQLNGEIIKGSEENYVDASHINLSDLGSQGDMGFEKGKNNMRNQDFNSFNNEFMPSMENKERIIKE